MDLYYVVNKTKLYTLIEEEVSKVADEAYAEGGQSLYDSIILTEKDRSTVERFMEDALNAFVATEDSISAYSPLVEIDENENEVVTPRLELNLPDFDLSRWNAAQSELDRYVTLSVCSGIFQSRRAEKVEEYSARAQAAMDKAVSLLKKRMVRISAPSGGGLTPEQEEKLNSLPTASELDSAFAKKVDKEEGKGLSTNDFTDEDKDTISDLHPIIGIPNALPTFSPEIKYYAGQYVLYDGSVYRFTETHRAGPWTGLDAVYTSVFNELSNIVGTDVEVLHIFLAADGGSLSLSGREVTVTLDDGTIMTAQTDEEGYVSFSVPKGKVYTVSVQQAGNEGYAFVPAQMGKAMSDDKYLYFTYQQIGGGYCVVKVYAYTYGERPSDFSAFEGKQVQIELSDDTLQSEPFDANGIATFSFVPQNVTGTVVCPKVAGYYTPKNLTILTGFSEQNINANYSSLSTPGIYFTLSDETDVDSIAITAEQLANVIAIHVATEELVDAESDFYVRPYDLWVTTTKTNYRWCEPNPNGQYPACPNVPIWNADSPYYNGKVASASMFSDLLAADTHSKNLDFAMAETLVTENRTVNGFLPTRDQFQVLVDNYESINGMLQQIDVTKSATYRQRSWWMATNNTNTGNAWLWFNGSWVNFSKISAIASWFPFFAI